MSAAQALRAPPPGTCQVPSRQVRQPRTATCARLFPTCKAGTPRGSSECVLRRRGSARVSNAPRSCQRACQTLPAPASLSSGFFRPFLFLTDFVPGPDWKQPSGPCPWQGPSPVLPLLPSLASWERGPFAGVSLSAVSAARGRSRPQKIEWKIPEINNSSVVNCMPFCMV